MTRPASLALRLARLLGLAALCIACLSVLGGGCVVFYSSDDDDDDRCYDDDAGNDAGCDDGFESAAGDAFAPGTDEIADQLARLPAGGELGAIPAPWVLGGDAAALAAALEPAAYRLGLPHVVAGDDPRQHPQRRVLDAAGPSLTELWRLAVWSPLDLTLFAEQVRLANADLLGLPPWAGELRHAGTFVLDTVLAVVWAQVPPGAQEPLADARLVLVFDGLGRLLQVENTTAAPPWLATPSPEAWQQR